MSPHFSNVAIVGSGITVSSTIHSSSSSQLTTLYPGPSLAILLKKHGVRSTIYESRSKGYTIGGSMVVTANGIRVLDHLGVYDQVRSQGFIHEFGSFVNIKGETIGKLVLGGDDNYGYPAVRLYRNSLREVLLAEATRQGIEIRYDMRCVKASNETDDSASLVFENGESVRADLVVGTDGMNSPVRKYIAPDKVPKFTGQVAVIGFAKKSNVRSTEEVNTTTMILSAEGSFATMPADGVSDNIMFFSTIETHDRTKEEWHNFDMDKQGLKDFLQDPFATETWPETVRGLVKDTPADTFFCWPFHTVSDLEHYVSPLGRVVIAGDAAHAIPPSVGQGGSISLEDAETLAITISSINAHQNKTPATSRELLARWEEYRKSRIEKIIERTKMGSMMRESDW